MMRSPQNIEALRQSFIRSPGISARKYSVALGISDSSARRILHKDLNFHPYKIVVAQELSDHDMANHSRVVERLIGMLSGDVIILMTAEAHFHLSDCSNKYNFPYFVEENPQQHHQRPHHIAYVTSVEWQTSE
jgi:hypothetical protein